MQHESRHRWSPVAAEPIVLPLVSSVRVQSGMQFIFLSVYLLGQFSLLLAPWSGGVLLMRTTVVVELSFSQQLGHWVTEPAVLVAVQHCSNLERML